MNIFIGKEIEGSDIGKETLFLGDVNNYNYVEIIKYIKTKKIMRIYFGANNYRTMPTWINLFLNLISSNIQILAEVDALWKKNKIKKKYRKKVEFILYINDIQHVKYIRNDDLYWININQDKLYHNLITDEQYKKDKEIPNENILLSTGTV